MDSGIKKQVFKDRLINKTQASVRAYLDIDLEQQIIYDMITLQSMQMEGYVMVQAAISLFIIDFP